MKRVKRVRPTSFRHLLFNLLYLILIFNLFEVGIGSSLCHNLEASPDVFYAAGGTLFTLCLPPALANLDLNSPDVLFYTTQLPLLSTIPLNTSAGTFVNIIAPPNVVGQQVLTLDTLSIGGPLLRTTVVYFDEQQARLTLLNASSPAAYRSTGGNIVKLVLSAEDCGPFCRAGDQAIFTFYSGSGFPQSASTMSSDDALRVDVTGSYSVPDGCFILLTPFEFNIFENTTQPLSVFISYDSGQTLFDTSVSLSIIKTEPMRIGWGTWGSVFDFGWSNSCNQARIQITATYGRSMESYLYHGIERTVEGFSEALAQNPPLDMWIYCSGTVYEINRQVAELFPEVEVVTMSGYDDIVFFTGGLEPELTHNFHVGWGKLEEARYLAGIAAGGFALENGLDKIGYIAALRIPQVVLGYNAFALGAQQAHPELQVHLRVINNFYDPYTERKCAEQFLAEGIRIIAHHTDSKEPVITFEEAGGWAVGSNSDIERSLFGDKVLTTPFMSWSNTFKPFIEAAFRGDLHRMFFIRGLDYGTVDVAPVSPIVPAHVVDLMENARTRLIQEARVSQVGQALFCANQSQAGAIYDNTGQLRIAPGTCASLMEQATMAWSIRGIVDLGDYTAPLPFEDRLMITHGLFELILALSCLMVISVSGILVYIWPRRNHVVIKSASSNCVLAILLGVLLSLIAVPLFGVDERLLSTTQLDHVCTALPWLVTLSIFVAFGTLFSKTWRVWRLLMVSVSKGGKDAKDSAVKDGSLFVIIFLITSVALLILALWQSSSPFSWARMALDVDEFDHPLVSAGFCTTNTRTPGLILLGYFLLLLIFGNVMTWQARGLPSLFNETAWIAQVLSSTFQALLFLVPLELLLSFENTQGKFALRAFSILIIDGMMVGMIMGPKLRLMWTYTEKELRNQNQSSMKDFIRSSTKKPTPAPKGEVRIEGKPSQGLDLSSSATKPSRESDLSSVALSASSSGIASST